MKAIALAAGLGTRLRPYTDIAPKPALPVMNAPLLCWAADLLVQAGATELVVNASYKRERIAALAQDLKGFSKVTVSVEDPAPLGSGGGVWKARTSLQGGGSFLIANGDEVILPSSAQAFERLRSTHAKTDALATIFVMRHPLVGTKFGGVWTDASGRVHGFGKTRPAGVPATEELEPLHYVGLQIVSDRIFKYLPTGESNLLYDALAAGIAAGEPVVAVVDTCEWFETGNPADFLKASMECTRRFVRGPAHFVLERAARAGWPGFESRASRLIGYGASGDWASALADCERADGAAIVGDWATIGKGVQIRGACSIGDGARIGDGASLEDCVILPGASVPADARIARQIIS